MLRTTEISKEAPAVTANPPNFVRRPDISQATSMESDGDEEMQTIL